MVTLTNNTRLYIDTSTTNVFRGEDDTTAHWQHADAGWVTLDGTQATGGTITNIYTTGTTCYTSPQHLPANIDIDLRIRRNEIGMAELESRVNVEGLKTPFSNHDSIRRSYASKGAVGLSNADLYSLKELFAAHLVQSAQQHGKEIAKDLAKNGLKSLGISNKKEAIDTAIKETSISILVNGEMVKLPLSQLVKSNKNFVTDRDELVFDFDAVRLAIRKHKKGIYLDKVKTINMSNNIVKAQIKLEDAYKFWGIKTAKDLKNFSEEIINKELKALTLLRRLVRDEEFTKYMIEKFIDVPDIINNRIYRIHRDKRIEVINSVKRAENCKEGQSTGIEEYLCIHLDNPGGPITDEVIAKLMFAKTNPQQLLDKSNKYKAGQNEPLPQVEELIVARA